MTATAVLDLERSGFTRDQVEALARYLDTQAATRADLIEFKAELRAEMAGVRQETADLRTELRTGLKDLEQRMTIRLGGMLVAAVAIVGALVKMF